MNNYKKTKMRVKFLSHFINQNTPLYGNRGEIKIERISSILNGNVANNTILSSTLHLGTHIDMPYHFFEDGQKLKKFPAEFWVFTKPLIIEIKPKNLIIKDELIQKLKDYRDEYDLLIVKTGICNIRNSEKFWSENFGFAPELADYIRENFSKIRVFGFDSISVSSFSDRMSGREAHKAFLNPKQPLILLEDMNLLEVDENLKFEKIVVAPLLVEDSDGLPCTVLGIQSE